MTPITFPNEADIDLSGYFLTPTTAEAEIKEFDKRFNRQWWSDLDKISTQHASIVMKSFKVLYDLAEEAAQKRPDKTKRYVTGVRITPGFTKSRDGKNIIPFFEPLYILEDKDKTTQKTFVGEIIDVLSSSDLPYVYFEISEEFVKIRKSIADDCISYYRDYLRIQRFSGDSQFYPPSKDTNWKGDTKSMIFSFKELYTLYHKNYTNPGDLDYTKQISCLSGAFENQDPSGIEPSRYKHTLIFSVRPLVVDAPVVMPFIKTVAPLINPGDLANLAHLCPPASNCDTIEYPL